MTEQAVQRLRPRELRNSHNCWEHPQPPPIQDLMDLLTRWKDPLGHYGVILTLSVAPPPCEPCTAATGPRRIIVDICELKEIVQESTSDHIEILHFMNVVAGKRCDGMATLVNDGNMPAKLKEGNFPEDEWGKFLEVCTRSWLAQYADEAHTDSSRIAGSEKYLARESFRGNVGDEMGRVQ